MTTIGTVESLWCYPVKSMRGVEMPEIFMGFSGIYGDRCYAFKSSTARKGFPYLNANVQQKMLQCSPQYRYPERASKPPNLTEAASIAPGVTPANSDPEDMLLDVVTPAGKTISVDDPELIQLLSEGLDEKTQLKLVRSDRALTDCRPISLISLSTIRQIESECSIPIDKRRFRANVYFDFVSDESGFAEDNFVGRRLRIGSTATVMVLERDPRCKMISLDPDTGEHNPEVSQKVAQANDNFAGLYCAVLVEGVLKKGDSIKLEAA
ncbi:MOSC domain-containing protein [Phormidium tenue]|uniref:MOSC domain-containing protein n=1 Tax=Phormidium tenue NIES-30 TaxID=549789 RepID=A0A1U7J8E0_9CYAN|nr:MOSC domain-containing protein [Phormidium tenue]MBD2231288.1 MOSC domain-containing protein [Phormidium tenue FACHB-1052]OKH49531.1 MOSC domain-containing protein [Phormidium tenue NIES-30]